MIHPITKILPVTKSAISELSKICNSISCYIEFFNSIRNHNDKGYDIENAYYFDNVKSRIKYIEIYFKELRKIDLEDFNEAVYDFLFKVNHVDNIPYFIHSEVEELYMTTNFQKTYEWVYKEIEAVEQQFIKSIAKLEQFRKYAKDENYLSISFFVEGVNSYELETKRYVFSKEVYGNRLHDSINKLEYLVSFIKRIKESFEYFMPILTSKDQTNNKQESTGENPYSYIQIERDKKENAVSGTNQRLLLFFTYVDDSLLKPENRNKIANWFGINLERFEKTCSDVDFHKTWFEKYCKDVRAWIEQTDNPEIINKFNLDFPH